MAGPQICLLNRWRPLADRHHRAIAPAVLTASQAGAAIALLLRRKWSPFLAMGTVLWTATKLRFTLPTPRSPLVALRISTRGLGWAVRQESALAVRHWWPATVAAACFSRHARGALLTALAVDGVVALAQSRNEPGGPRVAVVSRVGDSTTSPTEPASGGAASEAGQPAR